MAGKLSQKRRRELAADQAIVEQMYAAACQAFGAEKVAKDLTRLWDLRCMWGMSNRLPFGGGTVARNLGELLWVAREVCGLPRREE